VKVVFNAEARQDLREARRYYARASQSRANDFDDQVKEVVRTIVQRKGGDHVGAHGFPCRRCSPYPYLVYYRILRGTLEILGVVHERRHPDYLRRELDESAD
jgi:plasmid stabilization system protein ParE